MKFTFRYHRDAWTDIEVEADNVEEAREAADDKYNAGDYEDDSECFENTYVELID